MAKTPNHAVGESEKDNTSLEVAKAKAALAKNSKDSKDDKGGKKPKDKDPQKKHKVKKFLKDLKAELKKVVWPSRKQVFKNTGIVLVFMAVAAVFVWGLDTGFSQLLNLFLGA